MQALFILKLQSKVHKEKESSKVPQLKEVKVSELENISGLLDDDDLEEYSDF